MTTLLVPPEWVHRSSPRKEATAQAKGDLAFLKKALLDWTQTTPGERVPKFDTRRSQAELRDFVSHAYGVEGRRALAEAVGRKWYYRVNPHAAGLELHDVSAAEPLIEVIGFPIFKGVTPPAVYLP